MEIIAPNLTDYQKDILFSPARFTITEASTKAGKTYSHIMWLYGKAHELEDATNMNYWWVAPVYNQAKIAFKRFRRYLAETGLYKFNESNLIITCPNGAEMHFKTAEKPDNLYGEDVYACVFDEAPRARPESWYALRSTLTSTEAPCKLIGNFGGISNWVHKLKEKQKHSSEYAYFKITCWDAIKAGILSEKEVLQAKADLPVKIFKELYEAEASEADGQLINNESITKLFTNKAKTGIKYITADIARLGEDKTVIKVWDGWQVIKVLEYQVSRVNESVEYIKQAQLKYNVNNQHTIADEDGVGGGVVDYLKCKGFVNNSKPLKEKGKTLNFANLKSQCYYRLAEKINKNEIGVTCSDKVNMLITEELEWVRLPKEVDTSKIAMLSKDKIKEQIQRSPDYSDTLMMRMWFDISKKGYYDIR